MVKVALRPVVDTPNPALGGRVEVLALGAEDDVSISSQTVIKIKRVLKIYHGRPE